MRFFYTFQFRFILILSFILLLASAGIYHLMQPMPVSAENVTQECNLKIKEVKQVGTAKRFRDREGDEFKCEVTISGNEDAISENIQCNIEFDGKEYTSKQGGACSSDGGLNVKWEDSSEGKNTILTFTCIFPADLDVPEGKEDELELVARQMRGFDNCTYDSEEEEEEATKDREKRTELRVSNLGRSHDTIDGESSVDVAYQFLEDLFAEMDDLGGYGSGGGSNDDDNDERRATRTSSSSVAGLDERTWRRVIDDFDQGDLPNGNHIITEKYDLPRPNPANVRSMLRTLEKPNAKWATQQLLAYEKILNKKKGVPLRLYLNTAWLWFENDPSGKELGPDPYLHNCQDRIYSPAEFCPGSLFQIGGYQAQDRIGNYEKIYRACFGNTEPSKIMREVYENSDKTSRPGTSVYKWSYKNLRNQGILADHLDSALNNVTTIGNKAHNIDLQESGGNLNPQSLFKDERQQVYYGLTGKHPCMAAGLNSYAVYTLPSDIKTKGWAAYVRRNTQNLSDMIQALIEFDKKYPPRSDSVARGDDEEEESRSSRRGSSRVKKSVALFNQLRRHCGGQILASDCPNGKCPCLDKVRVSGISSGVMQKIKERIAYSANLPAQYAFQCVGGTEVFFLADTGREMINPRLQAAKDGETRNINGYTFTRDQSEFTPGSVCIFTGTTYGHIAYYIGNNKIIESNALEKPGGGDLHMRTLSNNSYGSSLQLAGCHVPNDAL